MKLHLTRALSLLLAMTMALSLTACGGDKDKGETPPPTTASPVVTPTTEPAPPPAADPEDAVRNYWSANQLTQTWGPDQIVEHLFFHPVIAYPDVAFSSEQAVGLDDWMVTVDEYNKILQSVYDKGYILVNMADVWNEQPGENGEMRMVRNTLMLPEGKKPLIFSFDDVNYYDYMLAQGFMSKLIIGEDGDIWAEGVDPHTGEATINQTLDATPILDQFVRAHPDFSLNGAKGCFSLTGYQGILGYRTQNDIDIKADDPARPAFDAKRQAEIEAVKPIIERLKATGWTFGSHTWGHTNLANNSMERIQRDTLRWAEEVGTLVGPTNILFYPHGARPDKDKDQYEKYGEQFKWLQSQGFRIFASVGISSYSYIKETISAVTCDRLHPDGTSMRRQRSKYLQFYDAQEILDLTVRPNLPYDFSK